MLIDILPREERKNKMKPTATQLKKIIAEEVKKAHDLQEANPMMMSPRAPARDKMKLSVTFTAAGGQIMVDWRDPPARGRKQRHRRRPPGLRPHRTRSGLTSPMGDIQ